MAESTDPFTLAYNEIWTHCESKTEFTDLIKLTNRIKFSGSSRRPHKDHISTSDVPELRLIAVSLDLSELKNSSSTSHITQVLEWGIATGDQRLTIVSLGLFDVTFVLIQCMIDLPTALKEVLWGTVKPIQDAFFIGMDQGQSEIDLNRGIKGWSAIGQITIEYWFETNDLILA